MGGVGFNFGHPSIFLSGWQLTSLVSAARVDKRDRKRSREQAKKRRGLPPRPVVQSKLRGLHCFLCPLFHVLGRHIFDMSGDTPQVSERVLDEAGAVSVEL